MCGIGAVLGGDSDGATHAVESMLGALRHRGPDAQAFRRLPGCDLVHTRLSIIDIAGGEQPMADATRRYWIVFNGEIYNYRELAAQLRAAGWRLRTSSDTEVALVAYIAWGVHCLDRFRGMFAFVIWDSLERRLFMARDIFGEKPLYYARTTNGGMVAASEIKAIAATRLLEPALDRDSLEAYLCLGYVPPDRTIYRNIETLPPGHYASWDARSGFRRECYWRPVLEARPIALDEAVQRLRLLLDQAVRRQLVADVPVGAFLSGGHDSSTIVALMARNSAQPVRTFSVGFGEWINELPYARAVATRYGTAHHEVDLGTPPVAELLQRMVEVYDEPFMDPSHVPTYLIAQYARAYVKVVLTGDGADELFGGYAWYPLIAASTRTSGALLPWLVSRSVSRALNDRLPRLALRSRARSLARRWPDPWERYVRFRSSFDDAARAALLQRSDCHAPLLSDPYYEPGGARGMDRALHFDLLTFLPGDILVKVDRAAMAHGLETRAPFLDRDVVEFALTLPVNLKVTPEQTKVLFKAALQSLWPESLRSRGKQGFAAPFQVWLARDDVRALARRVFGRNSALRALLPGVPPAMEHERSYRTWNLLTLGLWLERHATLRWAKVA